MLTADITDNYGTDLAEALANAPHTAKRFKIYENVVRQKTQWAKKATCGEKTEFIVVGDRVYTRYTFIEKGVSHTVISETTPHSSISSGSIGIGTEFEGRVHYTGLTIDKAMAGRQAIAKANPHCVFICLDAVDTIFNHQLGGDQ